MSEFDDLLREINRLREIVEDLVKPEVGGVWADWTPTVDQGGAVTRTIDHARYTVLLRTVIMQVRLVCTSPGNAGNDIEIRGIPATIAPVNTPANVVGSGIITNGATVRSGTVVAITTQFTMFADGFTGAIGTTPSFALANNDIIEFVASYER